MRAEAKALLSTLRSALKSIPDTADNPHMDTELLPNVFSSVVTLVALCLFVAGVMKVFSIANTLSEIRDTVKDIQRHQDVLPPSTLPGVAGLGESGDEMLRALDVQLNLHPTVEVEAIKPEILDPH